MAAVKQHYMVTVFCPKCGKKKRAAMSLLRLFGPQQCPACKHEWIPQRAKRKE